jgi:hypothetical protein
MSSNGFSYVAPNEFSRSACKKHVQDRFLRITELTFSIPNPSTPAHVVLGSYSIMLDKPKPDFDF